MTRLPFLFCILFCWISSFGQKGDALLFNAYKTKSPTGLQAFFDNWAAETAPVMSTSSFDDTVQNIYSVFQQFYNPRDIAKIGGSEWGDDIYKTAKYFIIQDRIIYAMVDTLLDATSGTTIQDDGIPKSGQL
jgi:hypothetical protein